MNIHMHDVANFQTCRFKFYMDFVKGYTTRVLPKYINIGGVFSKAVEQLHLHKDIGYSMAYIQQIQDEKMEQARSQDQIDEIETNCMVLQAMINGYNERFVRDRDDEIQPEFRLEFPFPQNKDFNYVCRLDGLKNSSWILEDKTTAKVEKGLIKHLPTNFQINSYWLALLKNGYNPEGVSYRYTQKPTIRQKQTETIEQFQKRIMLDYVTRKDHYFYEEELRFDKQAIERFEKNLYMIFDDILKCYETGNWYQEGTSCRSGFNTSCKFLEYCYNPTQETLDTYYVQEETHEYVEPDNIKFGRLRKGVANARTRLLKARMGK